MLLTRLRFRRLTRLRFRRLTRLRFRVIRRSDYHRQLDLPSGLLISVCRAIQLPVRVDADAVIAITASSLRFEVDVVQDHRNC